MAKLRVVVDTNAWISYAFFRKRQSNLVKVVRSFLGSEFACLASDRTLEELHDVMARTEWASHSSLAHRLVFCQRVTDLCEVVSITSTVTACRDAKDNKFLELALDGQADYLITGDTDLLSLAKKPAPEWKFRIVTPTEFLEALESP